jgi:Tol biopolymer transport system component
MMQRFKWLIVLVLGTVGGVRCSDLPSGPEAPNPAENTVPALIVSEALATGAEAAASASSVIAVAFVSLPPGTLSNAVSVQIRNLTTGGDATLPMPILHGGFDPVAVPASVGDRLALEFTDRNGSVSEEYAMVPIKRTPVVVRTSPARGRTDVALIVRPVVVFSEPIDPATLPVGMRLVTDGVIVSGRVELIEPWLAEFVPGSLLEPETSYQLEITQDIRGVDGMELEAPVTTDFTTGPASAPPLPAVPLSLMRVAFVSTRDGTEQVYLANGDGSEVTRLTSGSGPAWSWDDQRIAFHRETPDGPVFGVINVDGTGERILGPGSYPAWSPDGRIAFVSTGGISVMNSDGSRVTLLLSHEFAHPGCQPPTSLYSWWGDCVTDPAWSPDGQSIAFYAGDVGYTGAQVYIMNADGSSPLPLVPPQELASNGGWNGRQPAWSPDGARVAFAWGGSQIASLRRSGSGSLTPHAGGNRPSWSPDGRWLAYRGDAGLFEQRIAATNLVTGEFYGQLIPEAETPAVPNYWDTEVEWSHTIP